MNIIECLKSAISSIVSNKMRSILTMIGIIIGIAAVIMIAAAGQGLTDGITETFDSMGFNTLDIQMMQQAEKERDYLTVDDAALIREHPEVESAAPMLYFYTSAETKNSEETQFVYLRGTSAEYMGITNIELLHGRFLTASDLVVNAAVVVLEENLALAVFGRTDVIGETFKLNTWNGSEELTVVGVFKSDSLDGAMSVVFSMPLIAYVPVGYLGQVFYQEYLDLVTIKLKNPEKSDAVAVELVKMLEIKHQNKDMYYANNSASMLDEVNGIMSMVTVFISLVAAISLLVGGIGVMNIMLVSVTERTREIGIRKSLGATKGNIRVQFLVEAIIITGIGGLIGIGLGYCFGMVLGNLMSVQASVPPSIVVVATIVSCGIGVISGVYPAAKAAKLDPIEALRYE